MSDRLLNERSIETTTLVKHLLDKTAGEVVTYVELSKVIKADVQEKARHVLTAARRILQREHGVYYGTVYKVGIKRCTDVEVVDTSEEYFLRTRRAARRIANRLKIVRYDELSHDKRVQHNLTLSVAGIIVHATSEKTRNRICECVKVRQEVLPAKEMLMQLAG